MSRFLTGVGGRIGLFIGAHLAFFAAMAIIAGG